MMLHRFARDERAVSALEYAILVGVVVAAVGSALVVFADNATPVIENVGTKVGVVVTPDIPDLSR